MRCIVADLQQLHPLEETLGGHVSGVLALRMLYSSVSNSQASYHSFLTGMDRCLRHSLEPLDVLYFWKQAGAIGAGIPWMAVFAVDEVCMHLLEGSQMLAKLCISSSFTCNKAPCHLLFFQLEVLVLLPNSKIVSKSCVASS